MKKKLRAGILLYRQTSEELEVFLVHAGRAAWKNKGQAFWTIPQGASMDPDSCLTAALHHFNKVAGFSPRGPFLPLMPQQEKKGRHVYAWAAPGNLVPALVRRSFHFPRAD